MVNHNKILVIEDEKNIADLVTLYLTNEGFAVETASSGHGGLAKFKSQPPLLVILDLRLPDLDGLEVCREIRKIGVCPIIMLTARDTEVDKVVGLELGADDYITKPFSPREMVARVKAVLRRFENKTAVFDIVDLGDLSINIPSHQVRVGNRNVDFTLKEFDLLLYLARNNGIVLTRRQILDHVWGYDYYGDTRTVDVHVRQLRAKLGESCPVQTVWGVGYKVDNRV